MEHSTARRLQPWQRSSSPEPAARPDGQSSALCSNATTTCLRSTSRRPPSQLRPLCWPTSPSLARPSNAWQAWSLSFTSQRYRRPEFTPRRRPSARTCSAPTTCSKRLGCSGCAGSCGRRARRSSACRSSASSPHTRRSTRNTLRIPNRATRCRRCSRRSSADSCIAGPARRTSHCDFRTSWNRTTTTVFRLFGKTQACGAGICGATSTRATWPRVADSHLRPTSAPSTSSSLRATPS